MNTSLYDHKTAQQLELVPGVTFHALLIALIRRADTDNLDRLRRVFPRVVAETAARYHAPGGALTLAEAEQVQGEPLDEETRRSIDKILAAIRQTWGID